MQNGEWTRFGIKLSHQSGGHQSSPASAASVVNAFELETANPSEATSGQDHSAAGMAGQSETSNAVLPEV